MNKQAQPIRATIRRMPWDGANLSRELLLAREWLVTNGLGGYASGTISGAITRRYHGLCENNPDTDVGKEVTDVSLSKR